MSHELRTPLTSIRGSLSLVTNDTAGVIPEKAKQLLHLADRNAERLTLLINDLLDIEKIEAARNVSLAVIEKPEADLAVLVDANRYLQVMANLLSNAAKFSPPRSTIDVFAKAADGKVRVCVQDRGPGIPPEFQSRIFKRFSQADASDSRTKGGTGLGLAISKALIEQMNGTIGYETEVGKGTIFFFELPVVNA